MQIECPLCSARGTVDESRIPEGGRQVTCPRCGNCFDVRTERSGVEIIQQGERMVCPSCKSEQSKAEICAICGIVIAKYLQTRFREQEKERLEFARLRSATREVDVWYKNLFDRRLSSLLVRVMTLLVLLFMFITCSMNNARKNRYYAENSAAMRSAAEGKNLSPERNDQLFKEQFASAVDLMAGSTDACISQNYNYKSTWYNDTQPGFLSETLANDLSRINRQRREAETAFNRLPYPSQKYQACYIKAKGLANLNMDVCGMANSYATRIQNFSERLSSFSFEFSRISGEMNDCKESLK